MANILLIGCGDLGTAIAMQLHSAGHKVIGVRKSEHQLPLSMRTIQADVTDFEALQPLSLLTPDIVIYCVAASAQTDDNYYRHYVLGLKNVLATQQTNTQLKHVFFVSSTRVYGQNAGEQIDENVPAVPIDFGGARLLEAEQLLLGLTCPSSVLRLSGIYGQGRLYLVNMARDFSRWPVENHWSNRIHRDDAAKFISQLVATRLAQQTVHTCYVVTDCMPTQQQDVLMWMAQQMGIDTTTVKPLAATKGKRLCNARMLDSGFQFIYPTYQHGYASILSSIT